MQITDWPFVEVALLLIGLTHTSGLAQVGIDRNFLIGFPGTENVGKSLWLDKVTLELVLCSCREIVSFNKNKK